MHYIVKFIPNILIKQIIFCGIFEMLIKSL
jgi:hypothetical protein